MKLRRGMVVSLLLAISALLTLAAGEAPTGVGTEARRVGSEACKDCRAER